MFAALMLDIDQFKAINDTYGHIEGDNAIITAAHVLKKSVRKGDIVSRYGGDEFLIILDQCSPVTPGQVIERIEENLSILNAERKLPYAIAFSIGYRVFSDLEGLSSDKIFSSIDELMYQDKLSKTKTRHAYSQMRFDI
jgi:diguanylate cyclase (GGDEF)-like protein